jgi:hypothetical protein
MEYAGVGVVGPSGAIDSASTIWSGRLLTIKLPGDQMLNNVATIKAALMTVVNTCQVVPIALGRRFRR